MNSENPIDSCSKWLALFALLTLPLLFNSTAAGQEIHDGPVSSLLGMDWASLPSSGQDVGGLPLVADSESGDQQVLTQNVCPKRDEVVCVSARDDVWFVNARQSHLCPENLSQLQCFRLQNGCWESSSLSALSQDHATDKSRVTFVYAHGNRTDEDWAKSRGLQVYKTVFRPGESEGQVCERPSLRYVIFAWKSEQEKIRLLPDYSVKSRRSPIVGQSFGKFLGQFDDRRMVLCGYSLGAQVILAGLGDCDLNEATDSAGLNRYKVALLAPALDPAFVGQSLPQIQHNVLVERTEVFVSMSDRAIKFAEKFASKSCNAWIPVFQELGQTSSASANPVSLIDITKECGKRHLTENYASSSSVICNLNRMVGEVETSTGDGISTSVLSREIELTSPTLALEIDGTIEK